MPRSLGDPPAATRQKPSSCVTTARPVAGHVEEGPRCPASRRRRRTGGVSAESERGRPPVGGARPAGDRRRARRRLARAAPCAQRAVPRQPAGPAAARGRGARHRHRRAAPGCAAGAAQRPARRAPGSMRSAPSGRVTPSVRREAAQAARRVSHARPRRTRSPLPEQADHPCVGLTARSRRGEDRGSPHQQGGPHGGPRPRDGGGDRRRPRRRRTARPSPTSSTRSPRAAATAPRASSSSARGSSARAAAAARTRRPRADGAATAAAAQAPPFRFSRSGPKGRRIPRPARRKLAKAMTEAGGTDSTIPAGYTYLGQFIDHDLTFDRTKVALGRGHLPRPSCSRAAPPASTSTPSTAPARATRARRSSTRTTAGG